MYVVAATLLPGSSAASLAAEDVRREVEALVRGHSQVEHLSFRPHLRGWWVAIFIAATDDAAADAVSSTLTTDLAAVAGATWGWLLVRSG